jgi:hypothetical protein
MVSILEPPCPSLRNVFKQVETGSSVDEAPS